MSEYRPYIIMMFVFVLTGGIMIGDAIDEFKKRHYCRGGISAMFALSMILSMMKLVFNN